MPRTWTKEDIPSPQDMAEYLGQVQAVRDALPTLPGTPSLPPDMNKLTYQTANDIETVLLNVDQMIVNLKSSWVYSGEFAAGGI